MRDVAMPAFAFAALAVALPAVAERGDAVRPGQSSFFNAGKVLVLGLDVRTSRLAGRREFLPVQLVLLNRAATPLTVARESFTLVRPDGVRLPIASPREFWEDYPRPKADVRTSRPFYESVFGRYPEPPFHWASLDFFPDRHSGIVPRDGMTLRLGDGAFGLIYFRHPTQGAAAPGGLYRLLMRPAGAEDEYVVEFEPYAPDGEKE